jgi:hypothetical protein
MSNRKAQAQTRVIDGVEYEVLPLPGKMASSYLNRMLRMLAPGLGVAASAIGLGQADESALGGGLAGVLERFTEAEKNAFEDVFARHTFITLEDGRKPKLSEVFDIHFQGDMGGWAQWFAFCLEVNFQGFFSVAKSKLLAAAGAHAEKLKAARASSSSSPPAATGGSGAS